MKTFALPVVIGALVVASVTSVGANDHRTIVAFGDSTTAKRGALNIYADRLQRELPALGHPVQIINAGVGGNHTDHARQRFASDVLDRDPDLVIIQFGINDAAVDLWKDPPASKPRVDRESYRENLLSFVRELRARDVGVVLMTPNPIRWTDALLARYGTAPYNPDDPNGFNAFLIGYVDVVRRIAQDESVPLVDVYEAFEQFGRQEGNSIDELLLDGMHPNDRGHQLVADELTTRLITELKFPPLIESISKETLWRNRDGRSETWFHPRACLLPGSDGKPFVLMNMQPIGGSDYFGQVHWTRSDDLGRTWSKPAPIEAFGREPVSGYPGDLKAAVCDVTPQYHRPTDSVIALGHVVFYKGDSFARKDQLSRYPVYAVRSSDGRWSERKILRWDDPRGRHIYTNNCGQRVVLPGGDVQMSFTFGPGEENRMVAGVRATFDGTDLEVDQVGPPLHHPVGRGLLEPSITHHDHRFWMTIRAEDNHGYHSVSDDGLNWEPKQAWRWDDGTALSMSSTQQHWLTHSDGLFLVYTRKDDSNRNVIRWRSPLWMARVDPERQCLIKATERTVLPLVGDGVNEPDKVAMMGNFNVTHVSADESWVTVGETMPRSGYRGDVLLARIRWSKPNRLPLW